MLCPLLGTEIERLKRSHCENQSRGQLGRLADELQGVQKIMIDNIDAALNRGELISGIAAPFMYIMYMSTVYTLCTQYSCTVKEYCVSVMRSMLYVLLKHCCECNTEKQWHEGRSID